MVVKHAPLDPAGNPGAEHADEVRLDHVLPVEEVVAVGLVVRLEDAPADLRKHHEPHVRVLEYEGRVGLVRLLVGEVVEHGVGIHGPHGALVAAAVVEPGVYVRRPHGVGRQGERFLAYADLVRGGICRDTEQQPGNNGDMCKRAHNGRLLVGHYETSRAFYGAGGKGARV